MAGERYARIEATSQYLHGGPKDDPEDSVQGVKEGVC